MGAVFNRDKWLDWRTYYGTRELCREMAVKSKAIDDTLWDILEENVEGNLSLIEDGFVTEWIDKVLYGKYSGPVIVCGAGPSLFQNIEALKQKQAEGVPIIAVDRALKTLKENGIKPMLTVSVDPQMKVANFYKGSVGPDDMVAISLGVDMETAAQASNGRPMWFAPMHPVSPFWGWQYHSIGHHIATVRPGGVVGYSAVDIAIWCGFDLIVSIGNDFSWEYGDEESDKFYSAQEKIDLPEQKRFTIQPFLDAAGAFSWFPAWHPEVCFVDATDGIISGWNKQKFYQ
jgi:hypothetical protein